MSKFYKFFGSWIYVSGSLILYISTTYMGTWFGIVFLTAGAAIALADPLMYLFASEREDHSDGGYFFSWFLGVVAAVSFFLRFYLLESGDDYIMRIRLLLLLIFLFSFFSSILYRVILGLGETASVNVDRKLEDFRRIRLQNAAFSLFAALTLFVLLNYLVTVRNPSLDLSGGQYSFSAESRTVIRSLNRDAHIYIFLPVKQTVRNASKEYSLPELYRIADEIKIMMEQLPTINARIKLHFLNAELDADRGGEFGNVNNGVIIFRTFSPPDAVGPDDQPYIERRIYIYTEKDLEKLERETVRSLIQVASDSRIVYYPTINGERFSFNAKSNNYAGMSTLIKELRYYNFKVKSMGLEDGWPGRIPEDARAVLLVGPSAPYPPEAQETVLKYLRTGGRVFAAIDPDGKESLDWLLQNLGSSYRFHKTFVGNIKSLNKVLFTDSTEEHRITENLSIAGRAGVVFLRAGVFEKTKVATDNETKSEVRETPFLFTPYNTLRDDNGNGEQNQNEIRGRFPLGIALELPNEKNRPTGKLVIFSGVNWISNRGLSFPLDHRNLILATDSMHYLTESHLAASLVREKRKTRMIRISDEVKTKNIFFGIVIFPLSATFLMWLGIYLYRKKRGGNGA